MRLDNPFERPNPIRARQHTANLIYQEPVDPISRMSRRRSEVGGFVGRDSRHANNKEVEFIDLSLKETGSSKLEYLKLNNPYMAAREEPPVLTSRTNRVDVGERMPSFSIYQRPSPFYRGTLSRIDDFSIDSPMKNFQSSDLQGSRGAAISIQDTYSPTVDYTGLNQATANLYYRANQPEINVHPPPFEPPRKRPSQPGTLIEGISDSRAVDQQAGQSRASQHFGQQNQSPFPTQVHFEDRSVDELMIAVFDHATKLVEPLSTQLPEQVQMGGITFYLMDVRTPRT